MEKGQPKSSQIGLRPKLGIQDRRNSYDNDTNNCMQNRIRR